MKESSSDTLAEEIEGALSRNEMDTVFQLLEENYEMVTALMQKMQLTNIPEYLSLVSEWTLRMENAFQTINGNLLESTSIQHSIAIDSSIGVYRKPNLFR